MRAEGATAPAEFCAPPGDTISITSTVAGLEVVFEGVEPGPDTCTAEPRAGTRESSATLASAGCQLEATWNITSCIFHETQCERRKVVLRPEGDGLTGSLEFRRCWCGALPSGATIRAKVTARRLPPQRT